SQGMTLEAAEIDLRNTFECGQGYVALSRLKELSGLRLLGLNSSALALDPLAMKADKRFLELSSEADEQWTAELLTAMHDDFITSNGGTLDEKEIKKNLKKIGVKPAAKKSTYEQTKELVEQGFSIEQMAE